MTRACPRAAPPCSAAALATLPAGYAFPSGDGRHITADHVGRLVTRALDGAEPGRGRRRWTAHTLQHRFANLAYAGDRDLRAVQTLLGHSKLTPTTPPSAISETTARYTAVPDGALRSAVMAAGPALASR